MRLIIIFSLVCWYRFEQRLLHPGANTADIITQYVSAIKVLYFDEKWTILYLK